MSRSPDDPDGPAGHPGPRALHWRLRTRTLALPNRPLLMGILNVTPDSFSDGGRFFDPAAAVDHALRLAAEGADLIDVGGESTRPYSRPVDAREEVRRVMPVLAALAERIAIPISIDTSKAAVAREAIAAGAEILNDVTALTGDPAMIGLAAESGVGLSAMHMLGTPGIMQDNPMYQDVVGEVLDFLRRRRDALTSAGIARERIALDPGIGFGKTTAHNLALLSNAWRLHELGCAVLVGHSRKRFLREVLEKGDGSRFPLVPKLRLGNASPEAPADGPLSAESESANEAELRGSPFRSESFGTRGSRKENGGNGVGGRSSFPDLTAGTIGVALALARQGVQVLRVHDVAPVRQALVLFEAAGGAL